MLNTIKVHCNEVTKGQCMAQLDGEIQICNKHNICAVNEIRWNLHGTSNGDVFEEAFKQIWDMAYTEGLEDRSFT